MNNENKFQNDQQKSAQNTDTGKSEHKDSILHKLGDAVEKLGDKVEHSGMKKVGDALEKLGDKIEHAQDGGVGKKGAA